MNQQSSEERSEEQVRRRACVPCNKKKVKCDAVDVGIPCSRCFGTGRVSECTFVIVQERQGGPKRKRVESLTERTASSPRVFNSQQSREQQATSSQTTTLNEINARSSNPVSGTIRIRIPPRVAQARPEQPKSHQRTHDQVPEPSTTEIRHHAHLSPPSFISRGFQDLPNNTPSTESRVVQEDDSELQVSREISQENGTRPGNTRLSDAPQSREVIEHHGDVSQITIPCEASSKFRPKRFSQLMIDDPVAQSSLQASERSGMSRLDDVDREYLKTKGAIDMPPRAVCESLLRLYFECVYPYAPVLNRVAFVSEYHESSVSFFVLQAVFASVACYAPLALIKEAGFDNHFAAQKTFFKRACVLCKLGAEPSQLRLLQGSLILSLVNFTFAGNNDYRFWLSKAVHVATQMGLHWDNVAKKLDPATKGLFRRLWWVTYNRDALLFSSGLDKVRRIHEDNFDTTELEPSDWEDEQIPPRFSTVLQPTTGLHKAFLIESCKLSRIWVQYVQTSRNAEPRVSNGAWLHLERGLLQWRNDLPEEIRFESIHEGSVSNIWPLELKARSYLLECIVYRTIRGNNQAMSESTTPTNGAGGKLTRAMIDLDGIINKIRFNHHASECPLEILNYVSTLLTLHIEVALNRATTGSARLVAILDINNKLTYLRDLAESRSSVKWALHMFELIISRSCLSVSISKEPNFDVLRTETHLANRTGDSSRPQQANVSAGVVDPSNSFSADLFLEELLANDSFNNFDINNPMGSMVGRHTEDWLQDLLGYNYADF